MQLRSAIKLGSVVTLAVACAGCAPRPAVGPDDLAVPGGPKTAPAVAVAAAIVESPAPVPAPVETVELESWWQGFGVAKCSYLAPTRDFIGDDGGIDVVFHFHAGQMSEREMRESGVRGVFVSCGYGIGTGGYSAAFEDPKRFGSMMKRLAFTIGAAAKRKDVHLRHLALVSWSAGFAALNRILAVPEWYEATDTVVLLDSLHAQYVEPAVDAPVPHRRLRGRAGEMQGPARGADHVDVRQLRRFIRFANDAVAGKKTMVITHSAIVPPDYASTAEATAALLVEAAVIPTNPSGAPFPAQKDARDMVLSVRADEGGLHVRGFRGMGPHDHFDHLHLIGDALRSWVVPRWYTPAGERR